MRAIFERAILLVLVFVAAAVGPTTPSRSQVVENPEMARMYIFGKPEDADEAWMVAQGGRLYDSWWGALLTEAPEKTHPAYPVGGRYQGARSWRCVECHGWDYRGVDGAYRDGPHATGIRGIDGMKNADPASIVAIIRDETHRYDETMIPDDAAFMLALFISRGQDDATAAVAPGSGTVRGDSLRGRRIFQNVCAICHDYDGRAEITGEEAWLRTIGAVARGNPWQALHKIRNGQPSADMPAMRAFDLQVALDVLAYAQTLPAEPASPAD